MNEYYKGYTTGDSKMHSTASICYIAFSRREDNSKGLNKINISSLPLQRIKNDKTIQGVT